MKYPQYYGTIAATDVNINSIEEAIKTLSIHQQADVTELSEEAIEEVTKAQAILEMAFKVYTTNDSTYYYDSCSSNSIAVKDGNNEVIFKVSKFDDCDFYYCYHKEIKTTKDIQWGYSGSSYTDSILKPVKV